MASLPRPSRPSANPPNAPLPSIPVSKNRSLPPNPPAENKYPPNHPSATASTSSLPQPPSPAASSSNIPGTIGTSNPASSGLPASSGIPSSSLPSSKNLRKTTSYNVFPRPSTSGGSNNNNTTIAGSGQRTPSSNSAASSNTTTPRTSIHAPSMPGLPPVRTLSTTLNTRVSGSSGPSPRTPSSVSSKSPLTPQDSSSKSDSGTVAESAAEDDPPRGRRPQSTTKDKGNVIISVRVRPEPANDGANAGAGEWMVDGRQSLVAYRGREGGDYLYDNVFTAHDKNSKVYDSSAKRLVRRVMEGYHGTVFAYGMTGTGKTFSMQGTARSPGVIPLAITDIFSYIRETPQREFLLRVSYLEIYNEKIHDLLSTPASGPGQPMSQQEEIKLREDSKRGVYATPLKEEIVQSPTQLLRVIARGDHARRTSSTQYNVRSSRSHAVVQIVVESRERNQGGVQTSETKRAPLVPGGVRVSTLSLIDLAGSERAAESKERREEGAHINKSLLTLGTVIQRLSGNKDKSGRPTDRDGKHLPYRDSKLTRLLQPALSGGSLISILCTIQIGSTGSAAALGNHTGETLNTLKFAARARNNIVSHAKRAEEAHSNIGDASSRALLDRYRLEITELRKQLENQKVEGQKARDDQEEKAREQEQEQRHEEQMLEMQLARTALKERIEHLNRLILSSKSIGVNVGRSNSSLSLAQQRNSTFSTNSYARSIRSSASALDPSDKTKRESSTSLNSLVTLNQGSQATDVQTEGPVDPEFEEDDAVGENGDGTASLSSQVRSLQGDLADKNRYIATLEKRLLQARRNSRSRLSATFSNRMSSPIAEEDGTNTLMRDKDAEIADLRARLDDKDRMIAALKSAARKRDAADSPHGTSATGDRSSIASNDTANARRTSANSILSNGTARADRRSSRSSLNTPASNLSKVTSASPTSDRGTASPVDRLMQLAGGSPQREVKKTHGVDEMTRMLDEMIRQKVESGGGSSPAKHRSLHSHHKTNNSLQSHQSQTSDKSTASAGAEQHRAVNGAGDTLPHNSAPLRNTNTSNTASVSPHSPSSSGASSKSPTSPGQRFRRGPGTANAPLSGWESHIERRRSQLKASHGGISPIPGIHTTNNDINGLHEFENNNFNVSSTSRQAQPATNFNHTSPPPSSTAGTFYTANSPATSHMSTNSAPNNGSSPSTTVGSSPTVPIPSSRLRDSGNADDIRSRPVTAQQINNNNSSNQAPTSSPFAPGTESGRRSNRGSKRLSGQQMQTQTQLQPPTANMGVERDESPARSDGTAIADEPQEIERVHTGPGDAGRAGHGHVLGLGIEGTGARSGAAPEAVR